MTFTCVNATNKIIFHAKELEIKGADLDLISSNKDEKISFNRDIKYDEQREWFTIVTDKNLVEGLNYTLLVPYSGKIIDKLVGFYRGSYFENGKMN